MLALTENALAALRRVVDMSKEPCCGLRIMVEWNSCDGPKYLMGVENEPMTGDRVVECGAVRIYVDADSQTLLRGTRIDYIDSPEECGFVFDNPNLGHLCNCGTVQCH